MQDRERSRMMDVYSCSNGHRFVRAAGGQEEFIPCSYCAEFAKFMGRVDERSLGNNWHGLSTVEV